MGKEWGKMLPVSMLFRRGKNVVRNWLGIDIMHVGAKLSVFRYFVK
jgi:hypothetical protein